MAWSGRHPGVDRDFRGFSTWNFKCHQLDEMCSRGFLTTLILVDFEVLMKNFENALDYCKEV
jgi:hypothetical protein